MCVCVFEVHVLKILNWETILGDYYVDWIIGWVACWIAFMSVFFSSRKTGFKMWLDTSSIPHWHLAICRASQAFSYRNPDSSSILGGSIEKTPTFSIASRHLVDWSRFYSWIWWIVAWYLLDTSAVDKHFLDTYLNSFLNTSQHLICRALLSVLFKPPRVIRTSFHSISLSIALYFLSQTLSSHSNLNPQRFLQAFSRFSSLGKLLISHFSCISCFET